MKLLLTFLLLSSVCFGQSKKEQIEGLNKSIDSLNTVLATTKDNSTKEIKSLNDKIKEVTDEVTALKSDLTNLQTSNNELKIDLEELSKKNLELEEKLKAIEEIASANLITKNGIGNITLGMSVVKLRSLYDVNEVTEDTEGGLTRYHYCKLNGQTYFKVRLNENQEVVWIYSENTQFKTKEGITCSSSSSEIKDLLADVMATYTADGTEQVVLMYSDNISIYIVSNKSSAIQDELLMEGKKTSDLPNDLKIVGFSVY